jgi:hypothetical protein
VEQVRQAPGLDSRNFTCWAIRGRNSGLEYALQYQRHLKGLIISNMMASIPEYNRYAENVLDADHRSRGAGTDQGASRRRAITTTRDIWNC